MKQQKIYVKKYFLHKYQNSKKSINLYEES